MDINKLIYLKKPHFQQLKYDIKKTKKQLELIN